MILIALGANLPGPSGQAPLQTCMAAVDALAEIPGLKLITTSPWYRSAPISHIAQPDFCNGIARMEGEIGPEALLTLLQEIETGFGRRRGLPGGSLAGGSLAGGSLAGGSLAGGGLAGAPRSLDLDIIDLNGAIRAIPPVILPHPRVHLRAFVLRPILDVAPGWRHPTLRRGVASLLADLAPQAIEPWND